MDGYFNSGLFIQTVNPLDRLISPFVEADPTAFYNFISYQNGVIALKELVELQVQSIEGQLDGRIPATTAGQSANPEALVDGSSINLSALGSLGIRGGFGGGMDVNAPKGINNDMNLNGTKPGFNRENIEKAREIIEANGSDELTQEQLAQLQALGFTEDQITLFKDINQGGFFDGGEQDKRQVEPARIERQNNMAGDSNERPQNEMFNDGRSPFSIAVGSEKEKWIALGVTIIFLLAGLVFVAFYKRRRTV